MTAAGGRGRFPHFPARSPYLLPHVLALLIPLAAMQLLLLGLCSSIL